MDIFVTHLNTFQCSRLSSWNAFVEEKLSISGFLVCLPLYKHHLVFDILTSLLIVLLVEIFCNSLIHLPMSVSWIIFLTVESCNNIHPITHARNRSFSLTSIFTRLPRFVEVTFKDFPNLLIDTVFVQVCLTWAVKVASCLQPHLNPNASSIILLE